MERNSRGITRRTVLAGTGSGSVALAMAACGTPNAQPTGETKSAAPKEITLLKPVNTEQVDGGWRSALEAASKATNVKATLVTEPGGVPFWDKRQAEFAAGSAGSDVTYNQNNWVLIGGLKNMFVDHLPYMTRDKINQGEYIKIELDSWKWKNKQWGIPFQSGGEAVMLNKQIFQEKGVPLPTANWTYDDLVQITQRLHDPANN
ncbi:MAG TPA: ABC transporter substrate-binding protein, partial [Chloroflexota bacterium]|nr:ABC transporter substrate-binding protein [Chloroflexota bacterium]